MSKNTKYVPLYAIILATLIGFSLKYASIYLQIVFCGISIIVFIYEIIKLKKYGGEKDKEKFLISSIIFILLIGLAVVGKKYFSLNDNEQLVIFAIAFIEFVLTLSIFGYEIVAMSGDNRRIRQFVIPIIMLYVLLIVFGLFILYTIYH